MSRQHQHCSNILSFFLYMVIMVVAPLKAVFFLHFIHKCESKSMCEYAGIFNFLITVIVSLLKNHNPGPLVKDFNN